MTSIVKRARQNLNKYNTPYVKRKRIRIRKNNSYSWSQVSLQYDKNINVIIIHHTSTTSYERRKWQPHLGNYYYYSKQLLASKIEPCSISILGAERWSCHDLEGDSDSAQACQWVTVVSSVVLCFLPLLWLWLWALIISESDEKGHYIKNGFFFSFFSLSTSKKIGPNVERWARERNIISAVFFSKLETKSVAFKYGAGPALRFTE